MGLWVYSVYTVHGYANVDVSPILIHAVEYLTSLDASFWDRSIRVNNWEGFAYLLWITNNGVSKFKFGSLQHRSHFEKWDALQLGLVCAGVDIFPVYMSLEFAMIKFKWVNQNRRALVLSCHVLGIRVLYVLEMCKASTVKAEEYIYEWLQRFC